MELQKVLSKISELLKIVTLLFALSWIVLIISAIQYIQSNSKNDTENKFYCGNVDTNQVTSDIAIQGQALFSENCAQCHSFNSETIVGPGLMAIEKRKSIKWIRKWIKNPQQVIESGDKYAIKLYEKFNKTQMTAFPDLTDQDIEAILKYIEEVNQ